MKKIKDILTRTLIYAIVVLLLLSLFLGFGMIFMSILWLICFLCSVQFNIILALAAYLFAFIIVSIISYKNFFKHADEDYEDE